MGKNAMTKKWFNEIFFIRPILLVLLVSYHAFAPYSGNWDFPDGITGVPVYRWIGYLSRAFQLEGFIFISGYIFTYQLVEQKKYTYFKDLLNSKFHRLIIPSLFFSIIYFILFVHYYSPINTFLKIVGGTGHMWYLPCLFWCFLCHFFIIKGGLKEGVVIPLLVICTFVSVIPLPFQINKFLYYIIFFYGGGIFWKKTQFLRDIASNKNIVFAWLIFIFLFIFLNVVMDKIVELKDHSSVAAIRGMSLSFNAFLKMILAWSGVFAIFLSACKFCKTHTLSNFIIELGACGYGVYIFHQFFIKYYYYYSPMPQVGSYLLPWLGFVLAIIPSTILTFYIRKTKIGRKYM